jgi:hypothetical protein
MAEKSMQKKDHTPPVLSKFVRREIKSYQPEPADVLSYELKISEPESNGYNPYDKPGPLLTEAQIDDAGRRRTLRKRRK